MAGPPPRPRSLCDLIQEVSRFWLASGIERVIAGDVLGSEQVLNANASRAAEGAGGRPLDALPPVPPVRGERWTPTTDAAVSRSD
jgi:hypothetical protein